MVLRSVLFVCCCVLPAAADLTVIPAFRLPNAEGEAVEVAPRDGLTVVCFLGTECPLANLYGPRLRQLAETFPRVRFLGVNSNRQDSTEEWKAYGERHKFSFPLLKDHRNQVADTFDAERTPEVFVLDESFRIRYRGRIDDQYSPGISRQRATREDLKQALTEILGKEVVRVPRTTAVGCLIGRVREPVASSAITYCEQVARVLQRNCVECHREGEIGPFRLDDYEEVVGWAEMMLEVIHEQRMPPWHANPAYGHFRNARVMIEQDKAVLREWVEAGMPYGDPTLLPPPLPTVEGWSLPREPDLVLAMNRREFLVPADGTVEYQYFVVDPGFEEDRWVTAAQIVPGNSRVVHHSIVFVRPPDGARFRGIGWLAAYVPGARVNPFAPGHAIKIPAKSKLVFQQHYTPVGSASEDLTKLGLVFAPDEDVSHEVYTLVGIDQEFEIPPHAKSYTVHAKVPSLPHEATLLSATPHMHLRGKSFRLFAKRSKQTTRAVLLDVPSYDFNWQHTYTFQDPIPLAQLETLEFDVTFDNSTENEVNPDPSEHVTWGDQTWEEMAVAFFEVSEPRDKTHRQQNQASTTPQGSEIPPDVKRRMAAEADRILAAFDKNGDGVVRREETPVVFRRYGFWEIDSNQDQTLTREEIEAAARWRVQ